ncbi:MAG: hypothetical protein KJ645_03935, partial [Planctomycetes bacterium]|nr:hypothetical protein [Planctomycetota bacterium]
DLIALTEGEILDPGMPIPTDRDRAVEIIMENMDARVLPSTQIISISFMSPDPELAQSVVQELTELCLKKHKLVYRNPNSYQFLEEQEKEIRGEVDQLRIELTGLKQEMGVISITNRLEFIEENIGLLEQSINDTLAERSAAIAKIEDLKIKANTLPETHRTGETTSTDYQVINTLRDRLYELQNERQTLLSRFTGDSEQVKEKDRLIHEVEAMLNREKPLQIRTETWALNEAFQEVESSLRTEETTLKSLEARAEELQKQLAILEEERQGLLAMETHFRQLERDLATREAQYDKIAAKVGQARLEQSLEEKLISNISEIQPATLPLEPERSRKLVILLAGLLAGVAGGIFLAFASDFLDHTLKTPEQVENKLELPALVSIPRVHGRVHLIMQKMEG